MEKGIFCNFLRRLLVSIDAEVTKEECEYIDWLFSEYKKEEEKGVEKYFRLYAERIGEEYGECMSATMFSMLVKEIVDYASGKSSSLKKFGEQLCIGVFHRGRFVGFNVVEMYMNYKTNMDLDTMTNDMTNRIRKALAPSGEIEDGKWDIEIAICDERDVNPGFYRKNICGLALVPLLDGAAFHGLAEDIGEEFIKQGLDNCKKLYPASLEPGDPDLDDALGAAEVNLMIAKHRRAEDQLFRSYIVRAKYEYGGAALFYEGQAENIRNMIGNFYALLVTEENMLIFPDVYVVSPADIVSAVKSVYGTPTSDALLYFDGSFRKIEFRTA